MEIGDGTVTSAATYAHDFSMLHLAMKPTSIGEGCDLGLSRHGQVLPGSQLPAGTVIQAPGRATHLAGLCGEAHQAWAGNPLVRCARADVEYADALLTLTFCVSACTLATASGRWSLHTDHRRRAPPIAARRSPAARSTPSDRQNAKRRYRWPCAASLRPRGHVVEIVPWDACDPNLARHFHRSGERVKPGEAGARLCSPRTSSRRRAAPARGRSRPPGAPPPARPASPDIPHVNPRTARLVASPGGRATPICSGVAHTRDELVVYGSYALGPRRRRDDPPDSPARRARRLRDRGHNHHVLGVEHRERLVRAAVVVQNPFVYLIGDDKDAVLPAQLHDKTTFSRREAVSRGIVRVVKQEQRRAAQRRFELGGVERPVGFVSPSASRRAAACRRGRAGWDKVRGRARRMTTSRWAPPARECMPRSPRSHPQRL